MIDDMVAAGLMANTQAACIHAVRGLAKHTHRSPDLLSESDLRGYHLHLRDERGVALGTFQIAHAALQLRRPTTAVCTHLTEPTRAGLKTLLDKMMAGL